jgi:hypothetical protein
MPSIVMVKLCALIVLRGAFYKLGDASYLPVQGITLRYLFIAVVTQNPQFPGALNAGE